MFVVASAVEQYLNSCRDDGHANSTVYLYGWNLASLVESVGDVSLRRVREQDVRAWLSSLRRRRTRAGRPLSAASVQQHYRTAHAFFEWCRQRRLLRHSPMLDIPRPAIPDTATDTLSLDLLEQLLDDLSRTRQAVRNVALFYVLIDCGLRRAELCALRVQDADLRRLRITVREGKGGKGRRVPVLPITATHLRIWLAVRPRYVRGNSLFGLGPQGVYQLFRRAGQRLGVRVYPHLLRHTLATEWDGPIDDLQKILGHADAATTIRQYRHRSFERLREQHARYSIAARISSHPKR